MFSVMLLSACANPVTGKPVASILSPVEGARVTLNQPITVLVAGAASANLARIELRMDGNPAGNLPNPNVSPALSAPLKVTPAKLGIITLEAVTIDANGLASDPTRVQIIVESPPGAVLSAATPTPQPAQSITGTVGPRVVPAGCTLNSGFVADVTVPDDTVLRANDTFVKIWRLKNNSGCDWSPGYNLVHVGGPRMESLPAVEILPTRRNENVDVSMAFVAPKNGGTYTSIWQLRGPNNQVFGTKFYVTIKVIE